MWGGGENCFSSNNKLSRFFFSLFSAFLFLFFCCCCQTFVLRAWREGKPSVNSRLATSPLPTSFLSKLFLPLLEWMEPLNICHFPPLLRAPCTITCTSRPFSLISRPSQQQGVFPSAVASLEMLTQHRASSEMREKKAEKESSMISVWLQFSPHPPTQQQRRADVVRAPTHCHAEALLFFFFSFFFSFFSDGKLCRTFADPLAARHKNPRVEERCRVFFFFKRNFPPCGRFVKAKEEKTGIYNFSDALGRKPPGPNGDKGRPQSHTFQRSVALKKTACGKVIFSPGI